MVAALPNVNIPSKPQEAIILEAEIKKMKKQLASIKQKTYSDLETEEQLRASYENRALLFPKEMIEEEESRVNKERADLKREIKSDEARLEEVYPEAVRIVAKEAE
jgi:regulator of replication initiation timing